MSEAWITWIIQGATGLALGIIAWYMKRDREAIDKKVGKQEERIDRLEKEMRKLPFVYTTRDDFIRTTTQIDQKLDKILDRIADMQKEG